MTFFRVKKTELKGVAKEVTGKDIVKNLLKYTWPRGRSSEERAVKCSLVTSLLLMVASKVRSVSDKMVSGGDIIKPGFSSFLDTFVLLKC